MTEETVATFSIVGFDPQTQELGIAVQSRFLAVGSVVPWAKAGVGAVATQSFANTAFGPRGLALLEEGKTAQEALDILIREDEGRGKRQVGIVDGQGRAASYTGDRCLKWAGGDSRGQQSAALLIVQEGAGYGGFNDRKVDLRVDDHHEPIQELKRLYLLHQEIFRTKK